MTTDTIDPTHELPPGPTYDGVRGLLARGRDRARRMASAASDRGRHARDRAEHAVDTHPLITIGGAFLGGLLLGALLQRLR